MCAWEWLPSRRGLASGIILCGFGFGSFIFGFISTALVNPNNESPVEQPDGDKLYSYEVAENVPSMLRYLSAMWVVLGIFGIILVHRNPEVVERERKQAQGEYE